MKLALREVRRRPQRFAFATIVLSVLVVLLYLLGGLLDGLYLGSTGALRAQDADVVVYSDGSREQLLRSRIEPETAAAVAAVDGVEAVGGLGVALVAATVPGQDDLADVVVAGYELAPSGVPDPPEPGHGWADERLRRDGVDEGDTLLVGPAEVPVVVDGFVSDTSYLLQGALWVEPGTWREVQTTSRPDAAVGDGVFQVVVARGDGTAASDLAARIDEATGSTRTLTRDEAVGSLPGTREQDATFTLLIAVTLAVSALVSALFFALLTIERQGLYATLKALGGRTSALAAGIVAQAVVVAAVASIIGSAAGLALARLLTDAGLPVSIQPGRVATSLGFLLAASALGGALTLRRVTRIDPASAIS